MRRCGWRGVWLHERRCDTERDERVREKGWWKRCRLKCSVFKGSQETNKKKERKKKRLVSQESTNPGLGSDQSGKVNILLWLNTENLNSSDKSQMAPSPWDTTGDDAEHLNNHDRNVFIIDRLKLSSNACLQTMTVTTCRRTIFLLSCFNETGYSTSR